MLCLYRAGRPGVVGQIYGTMSGLAELHWNGRRPHVYVHGAWQERHSSAASLPRRQH